MASLSSLGLNLRLADIDENLKSHPAALSWPNSSFCGSAASTSHDFLDDAPCFAYTEVFERLANNVLDDDSGDVFQAVSPGAGIYLPLHSSPSSLPAFAVSKCRTSKKIGVEIRSLTLLQSLAIAMPSPFDFPSILSNYTTLKSHLQHLETISPSHPSTVELRLLVRDLLLDRALYAGIGTEAYRSNGHLSLGQLHDMHQRSVDAGLDDLDACFSLGLLPDVMDDAFLEALASRFTELALAGDMTALHDLCEPVVRSGEVEWETNHDLLLELLDRGRLDIYRYVLDLASRTRDKSTSQNGSFLRDITHDPLHVAIRLGHVQQVDSLLQQGTSFLGVHHSDLTEGSMEHVVLTPLSAAVYWSQPDIVRVILSRNIFPDGLREAVAMAVSNADNKVMETLLSFGVMDMSGTLVSDNTFESFADLSLMDQAKAGEGPSAPPDVEAVLHSEDPPRLPGNGRPDPPAGVQESNRRDRDRAASHPKEPVRRKRSRHSRRVLGQGLVSCMYALCSQLRDVCTCSDHVDVQDLASKYVFANNVWGRGLGAFRGLMQDSPPSTLPEVVDSLLVANAIYLTLFTHDETIFFQFVNDLDRWRSILPASSQVLFDDLALRMWAYTPSGDVPSEPDPDSLSHFQDLVQNLILLEKRKESAPSRVSTPGSRLAAIQRAFENQETHLGFSQGQAIPGRSQSCQSSYANSSTQRDDLVWAEFLHMEQLEDTASRQTGPSSAEVGGWEDLLSATMLLLVSVAFAIVLALILSMREPIFSLTRSVADARADLHSASGECAFDAFASMPAGYARCCALVAAYLEMHGIPIRSSHADANSATSFFTSQSPAYGSDACMTPSSSFSSLNTLGVRRNVSSSSISSMGSAGASSSSRPASRDHRTRGDRLPCLAAQCTKTFSSVSNRNKHLREGCAFTREKRQGYQCRNGPCARVLTTKWYRDTHEKDRCRFRRGE
ncbi:ankyrin repeat protein [Colletotrichum tofieldiae]|nr:ankyrin repeat protein [Colletotrichum tofieldiae]GKT71868.1 ankyrin repeat protein [Colletotrichum tofieldiae]